MPITTTAPPAPGTQSDAAAFNDRGRRLAVLVVALAFVMDLADSTILTIALPTIQRSMHASPTAVDAIASAYTLAFAVMLVTGGRLGDIFGYRRLFTIGVVAFMISSLLVALAPAPDALIAARLLQGASAALMVPQVLSVIQLLFSAYERVAVNGMLGGLSMLATTLAPAATALLIKANLAGLSWRPIFLINAPVCLAALALAPRYLPAGRSARRPRTDLVGTILLCGASGLIVFVLIDGHQFTSTAISCLMLASGLALLGLFAVWQRHLQQTGGSPLIIPTLFQHRSFRFGLIVSTTLFAAVACFALTFTLLLQLGYGYSAIHAVLTALPITIGLTVCVGGLGKKIIPALGRWSLTLGLAIMAVGTVGVGLVVTRSGVGLSSWQLTPPLLILGGGMGLVVMPLNPFILASIDREDAGSASGTANAVQQLGGALGIALVGALVLSHTAAAVHYRHAFETGVWLQLALLAIGAAASILLPAHIAPDAYSQQSEMSG